ncbi:hypothetical protein [Bacillus gaemokensis]|uniref:Uncharacterized protein n=1 Tax=Bacillus gaemokensis TaxID=574375 RepID=A0A073KBS3_9BACI|nr:hypothetical protein [Bacillus gaemokensis]KEK23946.1 hypothetical protein BAGA_05880 [Bacillus gaemokensis]KYG38067.1 hypothetical protein AZF08_20120 [Bacillus gaemokensis]
MAIYGIKDCANITLFDKATNVPDLFSDYANVSTNEWTSERTFAKSKGTNAIAWDSDRQSTLKVEMEVFDLKWIALVAGSEIVTGETNVAKREIVKVGSTKKASLGGAPLKGSVAVIKVGADEVEHIGQPLTEVETAPTASQFSVTGSDVTFGTDAVEGDAYAVYFLVKDTQAKVINISADKFPKAVRIVADALIREKESGKDEFIQIEYPMARPQSNFTITMSATEPTKLEITFDLFPDKNKNMATYKIIGE